MVESKTLLFYYLQRKLHQNAGVISTLSFMCLVVQQVNYCTMFFCIILRMFLSKVVWSGSIVSHSRRAGFTSSHFPNQVLSTVFYCYFIWVWPRKPEPVFWTKIYSSPSCTTAFCCAISDNVSHKCEHSVVSHTSWLLNNHSYCCSNSITNHPVCQ